MKNYKVRPEHIIDLVGKVAASFNAWQLEYKHLPVNMRAEYMHYMSGMLDYLINTAYPMEEQKVDTSKEKTKKIISELEAIAEVMRDCKTRKSPMDIHMEILDKMFGGDK